MKQTYCHAYFYVMYRELKSLIIYILNVRTENHFVEHCKRYR